MEDHLMKRNVLKQWLIFSAVVCAFIAFCTLPGVGISAEAEESKQVEYIAKDGSTKTTECIVLDEEYLDDHYIKKEGYYNVGDYKSPDPVWYVVEDNVTCDSRLTFSGHVSLILEDGCTLEAPDGVRLGYSLAIYGQKEQSGKLSATTDGDLGSPGVRVGSDSALYQYGAYVYAEGNRAAGVGGNQKDVMGNIYIYNGTLEAHGGLYGAGIGSAMWARNTGNIYISGGTVIAEGGDEAAGIGGGNEASVKDMTIRISGGNVTATGGKYGAGIGGGDESGTGYIYISGGNVTAQGGKKAAGIGCGSNSDSDFEAEKTNYLKQIHISGGDIEATGGKYGAGIGGGDYGGICDIIDISGGTVKAQGGEEAAGIGGGNETDEDYMKGTITISGGDIEATGGKYGAGIGGGDERSYEKIEISGGNTNATGGENADGIGNGSDCDDSKEVFISGGNIKTASITRPSSKLKLREITLEGCTEKDYVMQVNCDYGINGVHTLDNGKLYFYMSDEDFENLTEIVVRNEENGEEYLYLKEGDSFKKTSYKKVNIEGVMAKEETYDGTPKKGYEGTPVNAQGYDKDYQITYYLSTGERTTSKNSGAEGDGMPPVYAGDYTVKFAIPETNESFYGYLEMDFKINQVKPTIKKSPTITGTYGTNLGNMTISGGEVEGINNEVISGTWKLEKTSDFIEVPDVDTINSYNVIFEPDDSRNYCNTDSISITPIVEKATPKLKRQPSLTLYYNTDGILTAYDIEGGSVLDINNKEMDGFWYLENAEDLMQNPNYKPISHTIIFEPNDGNYENLVIENVYPNYRDSDDYKLTSTVSASSGESNVQIPVQETNYNISAVETENKPSETQK